LTILIYNQVLAFGGKMYRLKFQFLLGGFSVIDCLRRIIYIGER